MNKIIASLASMALVAVTVIGPVNAAALAVASVAYDDGANAITVTVAGKDFTADNIASWNVITSAAVAVADGDSTEVTEANGSFVITDAALDALAADTYTVSFSTVAGDFSAAILAVGNDNQVSVTAVVEPILTFSINTNALNFGTLPTDGTYASGAVISTVNSNAGGGIGVVMTSSGLASGSFEIGVTDINAAAATTGTDYYKVTTHAVPAFADGGADLATDAGADMLASQTVHAAATPVANSAVTVTVGARADATTEAGTYTDTLTFTATPTF